MYNVSVPMALVDFIPVIFYGFTAAEMKIINDKRAKEKAKK